MSQLSVHIWLLVVVAAITIFYAVSHKTKAEKKRCIQCITIILTCFSGLRSWQMGDVYHYCYSFLECNAADWALDVESHDSIGQQLFFRLIGQMNLGFEVCLFIIAAFSAITLGVLIFKYSSSPYLSYFLYICLGNYIFTLSALKQTIAMGFIIIAMMAILEAKPLRFLVFVGIATLFHTPAAIFLFAYAFARKRINFSYFVVLILISAIVLLFRNQIVSFVSELYYEEEMQYKVTESFGGRFIMILVILIASIFIRPVRNYDVRYRCVFNIIVVATIIQIFSIYDNVFTRLSDYYFQFFIIFVPMVLESGEVQAEYYPAHRSEIRSFPREFYILAILFISAFGVYFYINTLNGVSALLAEFHFFWEVDTPYSLDLLGG